MPSTTTVGADGFWAASVRLTWALRSGANDVVVMSTTGAPLHASADVALTAPHAFVATVLTAAMGALLVLLSVRMIRRSRRT